jgi:hypothetical protein
MFFGRLIGMVDTVSFILGAGFALIALFALAIWDDARCNG